MPIVAGNYHAGLPVREKHEKQSKVFKFKCVSPCSVRIGDASFSYLQDIVVGQVYAIEMDPVSFELIRSSVEIVSDVVLQEPAVEKKDPAGKEDVSAVPEESVPESIQEQLAKQNPAEESAAVSKIDEGNAQNDSPKAGQKIADESKQPKRKLKKS